jgi:DNA-binding CsgD family transcriptional regulator
MKLYVGEHPFSIVPGCRCPYCKERRGKRLTGREKQILELIGEGLCSKEIAIRLDITKNTVHVHRANIMCKLDLHTVGLLVRYLLIPCKAPCEELLELRKIVGNRKEWRRRKGARSR